MKKIGIINSGVCNLFSLENLLSYLDIKFISSSDPNDLSSCSHLILPGVGAFDSGMTNLREKELDVFIQEVVLKETPLLGICLGMQLLFSGSEEGKEAGLSLVPGKIIRFSNKISRVPHIGWNEVSFGEKEIDLYNDIKNNTCFYFIHSYYAEVNQPDIACHLTNHENFLFTSTIQYKRIYATQFHPEKSQNAGITLMKNFFSLKV